MDRFTDVSKVIGGTLTLVLMLAGCATAPPTEPPAPWMMAKTKPIADIKSGDDIIEKYAELRRDSGKDKSQIRGLQAYVRAIVKAK